MRALALPLTLLAACGVPASGPSMAPGQDCVACHASGEGPDFTAAGTLYVNPTDDAGAGLKGARVHLTDARGRTIALKTNQVGNFYTREKLVFPLKVSVEKDGLFAEMEDLLETPAEGGCNSCHTVPPPVSRLTRRPVGRVALVGGAGDEFMAPGQDCQVCHRAGGSAGTFPWSASGTVFASRAGAAGAAGVTVSITDAQHRVFERVTNRVGNFFVPDEIAFPARVTISAGGTSRSMEDALQHGSCNECHRPGGEGEGRVSLVGDDD